MQPAFAPTIRIVTPADAATIAYLHATSWQSAYRGILNDQYLDNEVVKDRNEYWPSHIAARGDDSFGLLMHVDDAPVGFAYVDREEGEFGNLLDNLHVLPHFKGQGLGRALLVRVATEVLFRQWMPRLYLWVYEANTSARAFYDQLNGEPVERKLFTTIDDGEHYQWRYLWRSLDDLR